MPDFYIYLISSLPMLFFGQRPPFSFARFLNICQDLICEEDFNILKGSLITGEYPQIQIQPALTKWQGFDTRLRNELVKVRAARKHIDPAKYIRGEACVEPSITHIALAAQRSPSILEAEKILDGARWNFLEELSFGHYFDLDYLIIYAHKLLILERWHKINSTDKTIAVEEILWYRKV